MQGALPAHGAVWQKFRPPVSGRLRGLVPVALVFLLAGIPGGLSAQAGPPDLRRISPDEAVELAIRQNLSLEVSRITVQTRKRQSDLSWNGFLPSVNLSGTLVRPNNATTIPSQQVLVPVPDPGGYIPGLSPFVVTLPTGEELYNYTTWYTSPEMTIDPVFRVTASLQASLNFNAALIEKITNTRLNYEEGLLAYEAARAQLERDVRKSYYQMLLVQEQIALAKESYEAAQRRAAMAEANYRSGLIPEVSYLQARVSVDGMKPGIDQAENGLKLLMASYAMNLGLPYDTRFELVPVEETATFIPLDVAELISQAASSRLDVQRLKQNILLLQSTRRQTALQLYTPTIAVGWSISPTFSGDAFKDTWFDADKWSTSGQFSLSLAFSLNTFLPFTAENQNLRTLDDSLRSLNINLAQAIRGSELEIYSTVFTLEQARASAEAQRATVDLAERTYRLTETSYRAGLTEFLDVRNAEIELHNARIGVLTQHFTYIQGLIDLEYAVGVPFGTLSSRSR
jgi:outer membrane protein TolC